MMDTTVEYTAALNDITPTPPSSSFVGGQPLSARLSGDPPFPSYSPLDFSLRILPLRSPFVLCC